MIHWRSYIYPNFLSLKLSPIRSPETPAVHYCHFAIRMHQNIHFICSLSNPFIKKPEFIITPLSIFHMRLFTCIIRSTVFSSSLNYFYPIYIKKRISFDQLKMVYNIVYFTTDCVALISKCFWIPSQE